MIKRIAAALLAVFMILVFSSPAFALETGSFSIYSHDGTQVLFSQVDNFLSSLTVTETGAVLAYYSYMDAGMTDTYTFTYSGSSFAGFATSANAGTAVYTAGNTYTSFGDDVSLYVVESSADSTTSVTIPISGAWKFNDTLDFSCLSSDITETVNFLSNSIPYTGISISAAGSLSYTNSSGATSVYGVDQSTVLYTPDAALTQYAILPRVTISGSSMSYQYYVIWYAGSVSTSRTDYSSNSVTYCYAPSTSYAYCLFDTFEAAVSGIKSPETVYSTSGAMYFIQGTSMTGSSYTIDWTNYYSSVQLSSFEKTIKKSTMWNGTSTYTTLSDKKINSDEVISVIGGSGSDSDTGFQNSLYKTIQFGQTPQEVSAEFYSWLVRNASPVVDSIVDADGDGYDDASYTAGQQAGYTVGYADGQASTDSYDLGYSIGYDTGLNDGQAASQEQSYNSGYNKGYEEGYNVGKDFSKNQAADTEGIGNFFTHMISAIMSAFLYLGFNISYKGTTILTVIFFLILGVIVYALIKFLKG